MSFDEENIPPGKPPRALNEVLGKLLRRMHVSDESSAIGLFSGWRQIVGDTIADHAVPKRLEKRVLVVEVDDPAWATQLKFLESQLIATLRDSVGDEVESLEIRVRRSR
jgi:predicted nucleic acid-binding Zn ribbon protein